MRMPGTCEKMPTTILLGRISNLRPEAKGKILLGGGRCAFTKYTYTVLILLYYWANRGDQCTLLDSHT